MLMTPSINCSGGQILYRICKYYFHIGVIVKIFSSQNNKLNLVSETKESSEFNSFLAYIIVIKNKYLSRMQRPFWSTCRPFVVSLSYVFASFLQSIMHKWHFVIRGSGF